MVNAAMGVLISLPEADAKQEGLRTQDEEFILGGPHIVP
jgi:hypothetical protein